MDIIKLIKTFHSADGQYKVLEKYLRTDPPKIDIVNILKAITDDNLRLKALDLLMQRYNCKDLIVEILKAFYHDEGRLEAYAILTKERKQIKDTPKIDEVVNEILDKGVKDDSLCQICFKNPRNVVIEPCRHGAICEYCAKALKECPFCRATVNTITKIFI